MYSHCVVSFMMLSLDMCSCFPSVLWLCWMSNGKGIRSVKNLLQLSAKILFWGRGPTWINCS